MFLVGVKLALVEGLRNVYDDDYTAEEVKPRRIDIEFPNELGDWPAVLVQFRANSISWSGVNPDEYAILDGGPLDYTQYRLGSFTGSFDLSVYALSSVERDRIYDSLVQLFLMGRLRPDTADFFKTIAEHDLIRMTVQETQLVPIGDTVVQGTPWGEDRLSYEATLRVPNVVGQFVADTYRAQLSAFESIRLFPYTDRDPVPGEGDGNGNWQSLSGS